MVLPKASCLEDAKITSGVELFCSRAMLGPMRIRMRLPTRRPKERPTHLQLEYELRDGQPEKGSFVPVDEFPAALLGFRFAAPGLLRGQPPANDFDDAELVARFIGDDGQKGGASTGRKVKIGTINQLTFARLLAKIGHAYAVAQLGINGFKPLLPDLILGKSTEASWLVGGDASGIPLLDEEGLHSIHLQNCLHDGVKYVLVAIRLFAFAGMPRYHVVVGEALPDDDPPFSTTPNAR